jgi:hypothetical protein
MDMDFSKLGPEVNIKMDTAYFIIFPSDCIECYNLGLHYFSLCLMIGSSLFAP